MSVFIITLLSVRQIVALHVTDSSIHFSGYRKNKPIMAHKTFWEEQGVLVTLSGTVTDEEIMAINDAMYGDKRFDTISYQIFDYTDATAIHINTRNAKVIGTLDRTSARWSAQKMLNIVVTKDENFIPIVEAYFKEFEGTHWECRLFPTLGLALEWTRL